MRVIAGEWRGRSLKAPAWDGLRPTSDRLRETLFNVLAPRIRGARVLDGYAGTGALGIEALSRGAAHVTFVERDGRAARLIEANLGTLAAGRERYAILRAGFADAAGMLSPDGFDLVLLDPPYADTAVAEALDGAARVATSGTIVVVEHAVRHPAPQTRAGLRVQRTVTAGDSALSFYTVLPREGGSCETPHDG
jgi:16S rRNA (guanine966-N2)-methyltransferase